LPEQQAVTGLLDVNDPGADAPRDRRGSDADLGRCSPQRFFRTDVEIVECFTHHQFSFDGRFYQPKTIRTFFSAGNTGRRCRPPASP
jgi:hypothetical protein